MYYDEELQPDLGDFYDGFDDYESPVEEPGDVFDQLTSLQELFRYCLNPTLLSAYSQLLHVFLVCFLFRVIVEFLRLPNFIQHILSALAGVYIHLFYFEYLGLHIIGAVLGGYGLLKIFDLVFIRSRGFPVLATLIVYLILLQNTVLQKDNWMKIQGPLMIVVMKTVSYTFDYEQGSIVKSNFLHFIGYALNPGTCIFGPWVSFSDYSSSLSEQEKLSLGLLMRLAVISSKSLGFFAMSVCLIEWIIADTSSAGWLMYRDALLFRTGQYFVSFTAELTATLAGHSRVTVTDPWAMELPHSLVDVVIHWNAPVHKWLRTYIFRTTLPQAGTFFAIMNTYMVSSLLHGVNTRISAILLSLGLYTYVEHRLRRKLARLWDACVGPRPCRSPCMTHKRSAANNIVINAANQVFTLLAVFHLAYLGCIMNTQTTQNSHYLNHKPFQRWSDALYSSHLVVFITFAIYCVISFFFKPATIKC